MSTDPVNQPIKPSVSPAFQTDLVARSLHLMDPQRTALVVIDVQQKLIPLVANHAGIVHNINRLLRGAKLLQVQTLLTEQYPQGLGPTILQVRELVTGCTEKSMFSCRQLVQQFSAWQELGIEHLVLVGIETHVCVQQSCLDLLAQGFAVQVIVDAVGARQSLDHRIALQRMASLGATLTTTEAALFEWCVDSTNPNFRAISQLVKESAPPFPESHCP